MLENGNKDGDDNTSYYESVLDMESNDSEDEIHNYARLIQDQFELYFGPVNKESSKNSNDKRNALEKSKEFCDSEEDDDDDYEEDTVEVKKEDKKKKIRVFLHKGIKNKFKSF